MRNAIIEREAIIKKFESQTPVERLVDLLRLKNQKDESLAAQFVDLRIPKAENSINIFGGFRGTQN